MNKRGIVVTPPFELHGSALHFLSTQPDPVALRRFLLYWDEIDLPDNNLISTGASPDFQFLQRAGVAKRTRIAFSGYIPNGAQAYAHAQVAALLENNAKEPGSWSLGQTAATLYVPPECGAKVRTVEVELYYALPAPPDDIPFAEILTFKEKRHTELTALRAALDELYLEVIRSADVPRSKLVAIDRLDRVLSDIHKVANESWTSRLIPRVQVALNIPQALAAAGAAAGFGLPLGIAAAAGAVGAMLKFDWGSLGKAQGLPAELKPYAYLLAIREDLRI